MRSLPSWTSLEYLGLALYTAASRQHFAPLKDSSAMAEARSSITVCRLMSAPLDIFLLACLRACVRACLLACLQQSNSSWRLSTFLLSRRHCFQKAFVVVREAATPMIIG